MVLHLKCGCHLFVLLLFLAISLHFKSISFPYIFERDLLGVIMIRGLNIRNCLDCTLFLGKSAPRTHLARLDETDTPVAILWCVEHADRSMPGGGLLSSLMIHPIVLLSKAIVDVAVQLQVVGKHGTCIRS